MALAMLLLLITLGFVLVALVRCAAVARMLASRPPLPGDSGTPNPFFVERLFSAEDWEFVRRHGSEPNRRMFRATRFALALNWAERVRREAARVWAEHRTMARFAEDMQPSMELRVFLASMTVQALCHAVEVCLVLNQAGGDRTFVMTANRRLLVFTQRAFLSLVRTPLAEAA